MSKILTPKGRDLLSQKIQNVQDRLRDVMSQKNEAYENGGNGWHDNFSFEQLVREETMLAGELSSLNDILQNASIVPEVALNLDVVQVGCVVTLEDEDGLEQEYQVMGFGESDVSAEPKKIEYLAPIIKPFYDGSIGDEHNVRLAGKKVSFTLTKIRSA